MRIVDLLKKQSIDLNASVADKAAAIDHLSISWPLVAT